MKLWRKLKSLFTHHEVVHFVPRLPIGNELSDGDKAALYGWPDVSTEEATQNE